MRVAIVHDWLTSYRGGEKVLESIMELYPNAPIYTLFFDARALPVSFHNKDIRYYKSLNYFKRIRRYLLPILPYIAESFALLEYDLVISTSSCVAKGVVVAPHAQHICYIHSPMRYIWDQKEHYLKGVRKFTIFNILLNLLELKLRLWDTVSAQRVDAFIANSSYVQQRVTKYYRRSSDIIFPPVDLKDFIPSHKINKKDYFLLAGAFVPYKRFDLAIQAANKLGKKLIVAGHGEEYANLQKIAGPHISFVISPSKPELVKLLQEAKALIFPALEDFGIIAIEALAAGTPLIAYQNGGALDYLKEGQNGVFFAKQDTESLIKAIAKFESMLWSSTVITGSAQQYSKENFKESILKKIVSLTGNNHAKE